jgi:hypothetical protein
LEPLASWLLNVLPTSRDKPESNGLRDSMYRVAYTELGLGLLDVAPNCLFAQPQVIADLGNAMAQG